MQKKLSNKIMKKAKQNKSEFIKNKKYGIKERELKDNERNN